MKKHIVGCLLCYGSIFAMKTPLVTVQNFHSSAKFLLLEKSDLSRLPETLRLYCVPAAGYICTDSHGQDKLRLCP